MYPSRSVDMHRKLNSSLCEMLIFAHKKVSQTQQPEQHAQGCEQCVPYVHRISPA